MYARHLDPAQVPAGSSNTASESSSSSSSTKSDKVDDHRATDVGANDEMESDPNTVAGANREAMSHQHMRKAKGWLTRGLTTMMQLPNQTPTAVLRWTTPKGPMPHILSLPSRDDGRDIKLYVFIPPPPQNDSLGARRSSSPPPPSSSADVNEHATDSSSRSSSPIFGRAFGGTRRPCLIDFHGGGFIMGGPLEQAPWCAALARSGIVAISVHYRLGPTWEFPSALLDAEDVIKAVLDSAGRSEAGRYLRRELFSKSDGRIGIDESRVGLSGFSSGGNIALNMLLSIPAHLNNPRAGQEQGQEDEQADDRQANVQEHSEGDWPSPFECAPSVLHSIPALLFFPSLDARQAPFERTRPEGMAPPGEVSKWIGRALANAYLPRELVGHLRASPGLAPIGMKGGMQAEVAVRKEAAEEHGLPPASDETALQRIASTASSLSDKGSMNRSSSTARRSAAARHATLDCMHPAARALLILPQMDTLSEQSEVWVEALDAAGKLVVSSEDDGSLIGEPLHCPDDKGARVRVHRIKGMSHGFTTYPDSFIDEQTRAAKKLVMEQARQFVVNMWNMD